MIVRNRLIALLSRIAEFALLLSSYIVYLSRAHSISNAFCLISTQTALVLLFFLFVVIIANGLDMRRGIKGIAAGMYMRLALPLFAFCLLGSLLYFVFVLPVDPRPSSILFHAVLFGVPLLEWMGFEEKGTVRYYTAFFSLCYPIIYLLFIYINPYIFPDRLFLNGTAYPYWFFAPDSALTWLYIFLFLLLSYLLVLFYIFLNSALSLYRQRVASLPSGRIR